MVLFALWVLKLRLLLVVWLLFLTLTRSLIRIDIIGHVHLLLKRLDAALGLVTDAEDAELLVRVILLLVDLIGRHVTWVDRLIRRVVVVHLIGISNCSRIELTSLGQHGDLTSVKILLSGLDLLSTSLLLSHPVPEESSEESEK